MMQQQQPDSIPENGQPTVSVPVVQTQVISPEKATRETAECRAAIFQIGEHMKEIEHLVQRMQLFAPHMSSVSPVSDFITRWSEFRNGNWVFRESVGV